jgi:hypothetical protein
MQYLRRLQTPLALYQDGLLISQVYLRSIFVCHSLHRSRPPLGGAPKNKTPDKGYVSIPVPIPSLWQACAPPLVGMEGMCALGVMLLALVAIAGLACNACGLWRFRHRTRDFGRGWRRPPEGAHTGGEARRVAGWRAATGPIAPTVAPPLPSDQALPSAPVRADPPTRCGRSRGGVVGRSGGGVDRDGPDRNDPATPAPLLRRF